MQNENFIKGNEIVVFADSKIYTNDGILKCLYWYGEKFHTNLSLTEDKFFKITLKPISNIILSFEELEQFQQKLERDLVDFNLRDIVTKETKNIRDLLIAKAFSNGEFDEVPKGNVSDPVGFDIKGIKK